MEKSSSKRGPWSAEDTQDGGSSSGSTGSKVDPARGGRVVEPGRDSQPEPEAATVDEDGGGETGSDTTKVDKSRTRNVKDPARD
jgi:hypothetical protein